MHAQNAMNQISATANESISVIDLIRMKKELQAEIETL